MYNATKSQRRRTGETLTGEQVLELRHQLQDELVWLKQRLHKCAHNDVPWVDYAVRCARVLAALMYLRSSRPHCDGPVKRFLPIAALCAATMVLAHCGGSYDYPAPTSPAAAVEAFMNAVRADSHLAMGQLWGSSNGPAVGYMDPTVLEQRLTIMQLYLDHESYEIVESNAPGTERAGPNRLVLRVRLERGGCTPVVPFTIVRYRNGWLVAAIDLEAAGNPARFCQ